MPILSGHITVVAVGKMRKSHWKTALDDYQKRLNRYTHFKLIEVKDAVGRGLPDAVAIKKEGEQLLKAAAVHLPDVLPCKGTRVASRKKLPKNRLTP